jgi:hypothetical protein
MGELPDGRSLVFPTTAGRFIWYLQAEVKTQDGYVFSDAMPKVHS